MLILLAGCGAVRPTPSRGTLARGPTTAVFVARRGWHIDVGIAVPALGRPLLALGARFPGARYLMFGFGDRHYLMSRYHSRTQLLAALWPGPGLMLVTGLTATPAEAFGADHVLTLDLDQAQARAWQAFLYDSLSDLGRSGQPEAPGPYQGSLYFGATPRYSAAHTCNTWAAESLRASGLPVHGFGIVFAGQLWVQITRLSHLQAKSHEADGLPAGVHQ